MKHFLMLFIILFLFTGCTKKLEVYDANMFYMDTYINVKIYANKDLEAKAKKALLEVEDIYAYYHKLTNRYESYDGIINVYYLNNTLENNKTIAINPKLSQLINYSVDAYDLTDGNVNIALGNLIDVWKKYRDLETGIPSMEELQNISSIKIEDIKIDNNNYLKNNNVSLDLGATAKGYVTEEVGKYLVSQGFDKYLINAGGNVKVGKHYENKLYKIGIRSPIDKDDIFKVVNITNLSVVSSGSYERFYEYQGKKYHHIIDSKTFFPPNYMKSVSIITEDSAMADILSTYIFLLPIEEGQKIINKLDNVSAIWFTNDDKIITSENINYE